VALVGNFIKKIGIQSRGSRGIPALEITLQKAGCFCGISLGKNPFGWRLAF
jgi:hypothetical protein